MGGPSLKFILPKLAHVEGGGSLTSREVTIQNTILYSHLVSTGYVDHVVV